MHGVNQDVCNYQIERNLPVGALAARSTDMFLEMYCTLLWWSEKMKSGLRYLLRTVLEFCLTLERNIRGLRIHWSGHRIVWRFHLFYNQSYKYWLIYRPMYATVIYKNVYIYYIYIRSWMACTVCATNGLIGLLIYLVNAPEEEDNPQAYKEINFWSLSRDLYEKPLLLILEED